MNILCIGDVVGDNAVAFLQKKLWGFRKLKGVDFCVVNGENAAVLGIEPHQAQSLFAAGADVITLGNHAFQKKSILPFLEERRDILRPANLSPLSPGVGWGEFETPRGTVAVINLIGRCEMDFGPDNPFFEAERIVNKLSAKIVLVDFHAEATSEKAALAWHLDGRVSALWGTHTHVQTSDGRVLPQGTGFITDLGMTGAENSILGVRPEQSVNRFLGAPRRTPYLQAEGPCKMEGALFEIDPETGLCLGVEAVRVSQ